MGVRLIMTTSLPGKAVRGVVAVAEGVGVLPSGVQAENERRSRMISPTHK
jgi:hypothetical protein